jgi:hypothetical protein
MSPIETANEAKRQLLAINTGVKGLPPIKAVTVVLGDTGFRLEVKRGQRYSNVSIPASVLGVPVVTD